MGTKQNMDRTTQASAIVAQTSTPAPTQTSSPITPTPAGLDWTAILVPLLPAVATGVLVGLIAPILTPYVKWHFEKERRRHDRRLKLVEKRQELISDSDFSIFELASLPTFPSILRMFSRQSKAMFREYEEEHYAMMEAYSEERLGLKISHLPKSVKMPAIEKHFDGNAEGMNKFYKELESVDRLEGEKIKDFIRNELAEIEAKWGLL